MRIPLGNLYRSIWALFALRLVIAVGRKKIIIICQAVAAAYFPASLAIGY